MHRVFPLLLLCAAAHAAEVAPIADWTSFDAWAADARNCARFAGALYPPGMVRAGESLGIVPFDGAEIPALLALPDEPLIGSVRARRVFLEESMGESRSWSVRDADGGLVRTLVPPAGYDPEGWIEDEYGAPPVWLSGPALAAWRAARDPSRIVPTALLVAASDLPSYHAAVSAAATNAVADTGGPHIPAATNAPAFAAFTMDADGVPSGWLWSPWPDRAHSVFRKESLADPLWTPALGLFPDAALTAWADAAPVTAASLLRSAPASSGSTGFYAAAEVETDSDRDGLPDGMERLAHGSSPFLSDSDGDGLSDFEEINRYGTSPYVADTNGDGISDGAAVRKLLDPVSADTDGDGLTDADEILLCMTDPRNADTDNDGLTDYDEVVVHGTSPFENDTDGDKLSDRKEVGECGTSPLLRDTDGDGMDDDYEWIARSLGFDPADPSDGLLDRDGDGIPNAEEYAWGWSNFTRASSNAVPRTSLLSSQAGEAPVFRSGVAQVLAFGRNGESGTRIRIPKSVQLGTNAIARTLHWTAAPGLRLGDISLDQAGSFPVPDENVELDVWAAPSAGGAESTLSLVDAAGQTNGTLRVRAPFLSGIDFYLSSARTPLPYHTNIVAGVPGVICVPADDPLYGKPRAYLHPNYPSVLDTGHRLLDRTGFLLARVSGATPEATLPVDANRWDGAWGVSDKPRRGFELEPGLSRIEAGIDFSLDGVLDPDEVEVVCDVHVVPVRLCADTDRDGAVTPADRDARDRWEPSRGALLAPDAAPDSVDAYRPPVGRPLSPLVVRSTGVPLPEGWSMRLQSSVGSGTGTRLSNEGHAGWVSLYNWTTNGLGDLAAGDASFLLSHTNPAGADAAETMVTLSLCHGGQTLGTDTVSLRHAPLIVPWNTLPLKRLYTAGSVGGLRFPPEVEPAKQRCFPSRGVQWVQDMMQLTALQLDEEAGGTPVAIDLERPNENEFVDLLPASVGAAYGEFLGYVWCDNHGDGGNVEATPPLPGYPFGRLLTGVGENGRVCNAVKMLEKQGLQGPAITVPVDWLAVGHVDEVCCFVDDRTVLVPSPRLAFDLIAEQVVLHGGNYTNTFVWGLDPANYVHRMQDILFDYVIPSDWAFSPFSSWDTSFETSYDGFHPGDKLLCGNEVMEVSGIFRNGESFLVTVLRGRHGTEATSHSSQDTLLCLSDIGFANGFDDANIAPLQKINAIKTRLHHAIPELSFVDMPILFIPCGTQFVAGSANMVNAIVSGRTIYMTDPGCALFRDAVSVPGAAFVGGTNVWALYHCRMGELHCGSEAERWLPASPPFWKRPEFKAWPFEKKGTTP